MISFILYSQSAAFGSYCAASGGKLAALAGPPAARASRQMTAANL